MRTRLVEFTPGYCPEYPEVIYIPNFVLAGIEPGIFSSSAHSANRWDWLTFAYVKHVLRM